MKVYFDTCSLNRPLDERSQLRVALESEAMLRILALCESGNLSLIASEALVLENERNPESRRKAFVAAILDCATRVIKLTDEIVARGRSLEKRGFKAFDALHLGCAESDAVDCFCTCDDKLLKKARRQTDLKVKVLSPLELANEVSA